MSSQNNNKYYQTREQRLDTVAGDVAYWKKLMAARDEYLALNGQYDEGFYLWMDNTYGVKVIIDTGAISKNHMVTDEKKYLIFNLKF